jgi:beta-lactamase regulating signal transducer with metallopeptidase domain
MSIAFTWLVSAAWKGSLLLLPLLLLLFAFRDRVPPRWRFALLFVAMLRLAVPVAPSAPFSVFNLAPQGNRPAPIRISMTERTTGTPVRIAVQAPVARPVATLYRWRTPLFAIWAFGALALLLRVLVRSVRLHRRIHGEPVVAAAADLQHLLQSCCEALDIKRIVELRLTTVVSSPSLLGMLKPALLLPADLPHSLTTEQLRFVFLHELAHLRRSDVLLNWIATLIHALHWFNPLVWIAASHLAEDRELACDAVALGALERGERTAYGATVIQLLDRLRMPSPVPALVGMAPTRHQAKRRIQMIASFRTESRRAAWFAVAVIALALATLTDATAGERTFVRHMSKMPAEAKAIMATLDKNLSLDFASASLEDIVWAVGNSAGVTVKFADDALTPETRAARMKLTARDIPAHIALNETLHAFDLAMKFTAEGITVVKQTEGGLPHELRLEGIAGDAAHGNERVFVIQKKLHDGDDVVISGDEVRSMPAPSEIRTARRMRVDVDSLREKTDGVNRRKVTFVGADDKQGTFELEVLK